MKLIGFLNFSVSLLLLLLEQISAAPVVNHALGRTAKFAQHAIAASILIPHFTHEAMWTAGGMVVSALGDPNGTVAQKRVSSVGNALQIVGKVQMLPAVTYGGYYLNKHLKEVDKDKGVLPNPLDSNINDQSTSFTGGNGLQGQLPRGTDPSTSFVDALGKGLKGHLSSGTNPSTSFVDGLGRELKGHLSRSENWNTLADGVSKRLAGHSSRGKQPPPSGDNQQPSPGGSQSPFGSNPADGIIAEPPPYTFGSSNTAVSDALRSRAEAERNGDRQFDALPREQLRSDPR